MHSLKSYSGSLRLIALLCALFTSACAGVDPFGPQPLAGAVRSAVIGHGNVWVNLEDDGTAVLQGWVGDQLSLMAVERTVLNYPGVTLLQSYLIVDDFRR